MEQSGECTMRFIRGGDYSSPQAAEFLSQRSSIPHVMLPYTVGGTDRAKDLFGLFDDTIERLLKTVK